MAELGLTELGIARIARTVYSHLGLISYFTAGETEVHAWTIKRGGPQPKRPQAKFIPIWKGVLSGRRLFPMPIWYNMAACVLSRKKVFFAWKGKII